MVMQIVCSCGRRLQSSVARPGQLCLCPVCKQTLVFPEEDNPAPTAAQPLAIAPSPLLAPETVPPAPPDNSPSLSRREAEAVAALVPDLTAELDARPLASFLEPPSSIALATLLGGPAGGGFAMARNEWRSQRRMRALLFGTLGFALNLVFFAGLVLTTSIADLASFLALLVVGWGITVPLIYMLASVRYREAHQLLRERNVLAASLKRTLGFTVPVVLLNLVLLGVGVMANESYHTSKDYEVLAYGPREDLYFSHEVSRDLAAATGEALQQAGYFNQRGGKTVRLRREAGGIYALDFTLRESTWEDPQIWRYYQDLGQWLSTQVFGGAPLRIYLCDVYYHSRLTLRIAATRLDTD